MCPFDLGARALFRDGRAQIPGLVDIEVDRVAVGREQVAIGLEGGGDSFGPVVEIVEVVAVPLRVRFEMERRAAGEMAVGRTVHCQETGNGALQRG